MFYICTVSAEKTDGPHHGDRETCGQYKKATLTNYAYTPLLILCMQEFVPQGVRQRVWCVQNCVLSCPMSVKKQMQQWVCSLYVCSALYPHCKGYWLLLVQYCVQQTKGTCIKGLDRTSLFMWKWIPSKRDKTAFTLGYTVRFWGSTFFFLLNLREKKMGK